MRISHVPLYCPLGNIYRQPSFVPLSFPFSIFKLNNSRPFAFTTEHNHQEISQGEKKKIIIIKETNKQEPLFIGISQYIKWLFLRMLNLGIISVCLGHLGGRGGGRDTETAATYLKPFKSGNTNCISLGPWGWFWTVGHVFVLPVHPVWSGMMWFFCGSDGDWSHEVNCDPVCFLLGECVGSPLPLP